MGRERRREREDKEREEKEREIEPLTRQSFELYVLTNITLTIAGGGRSILTFISFPCNIAATI